MKKLKYLLVIATVVAISASAFTFAKADDNEDNNGQNNFSHSLNEQLKKVMENNRELAKQQAEHAFENNSSADNGMGNGQQPASLTINPNGNVNLNSAIVVTAPGAGNSFSVKIWGLTFVVNFDSTTQLTGQGGSISASDIQVNDKVSVAGTTSDSTPGVIQARQLKDHTVASRNVGGSDELTRIRAQIQMLMDKLNELLARAGGTPITPTPTSTVPVVPTLAALSPTSTLAGNTAFTLTLTGTNFLNTSTINWGSTTLPATFVSATQLTANVPAANVSATTTVLVSVINPGTSGGTSNALTFTVR